MAKLVLGIGSSHTPMLNAPAEDWPRFIDRDGIRDFLDKEGEPATYEQLLARAEPHVAAELTPARFAARHAEAQAGVDRLKEAVKRAELDALIVIGDDHKELYQDDNMPALVVYYGKTIRNHPLNGFSGPEWSRRATARYYEERAPKDYPVASDLALHLINSLIDRESRVHELERLKRFRVLCQKVQPLFDSLQREPAVVDGDPARIAKLRQPFFGFFQLGFFSVDPVSIGRHQWCQLLRQCLGVGLGQQLHVENQPCQFAIGLN